MCLCNKFHIGHTLRNFAPINKHFSIVCPNHVRANKNGRGFTSMQQPMDKRRRLRHNPVVLLKEQYVESWKFALLFGIRLNFTVLYVLQLASFLHWLLHRYEVTPFLAELHVIGAHDCEVLIYWGRVTHGVSEKVWSSVKRIAEWLGYSPPTHSNRVRFSAGPLPDSHMWELCQTMPLVGEFSRGSPVSPGPCIPALLHNRLALPSSALETSIYQLHIGCLLSQRKATIGLASSRRRQTPCGPMAKSHSHAPEAIKEEWRKERDVPLISSDSLIAGTQLPGSVCSRDGRLPVDASPRKCWECLVASAEAGVPLNTRGVPSTLRRLGRLRGGGGSPCDVIAAPSNLVGRGRSPQLRGRRRLRNLANYATAGTTLVHTVFDISWRMVAQSSPYIVTADSQFAVVHMTVQSGLQVIELMRDVETSTNSYYTEERLSIHSPLIPCVTVVIMYSVSSIMNAGTTRVRGRGGWAVRLLASHLSEPGSISSGVAPHFCMWKSCRSMQLVRRVFSEISHFPYPFIPTLFHTHHLRPRWLTGHPVENPPTSGIVRHVSHLRKSGVNRLVGGEHSNRSATAAPVFNAGYARSTMAGTRIRCTESEQVTQSVYNLQSDAHIRGLRTDTREKDGQLSALPCPFSTIGATVAERLARSPPTRANRVQSPARFSQVGIVPDDAVGRRVFSGSPVSPAPSFRRRSILQSLSSALKTSLLRAARISSLTHIFS
ncbi:hypothetical protein PR048_031186 [Dryococelus australis]|uniref:Uncharacterized protein n=1 Tax=Dryococelus australis TaxID=614101 RepID=A0ABQ9G4K0_9NEOP|nr:hypothetical protein PR048_031186 [Dryococelus australis]